MPSIRRSCSNRIITRALEAEGRPLLAMSQPGVEVCEIGADAKQLRTRLEAVAQAIIVYNQQADASALVDRLEPSPAQVFIEIRQDFRGVLGLQA